MDDFPVITSIEFHGFFHTIAAESVKDRISKSTWCGVAEKNGTPKQNDSKSYTLISISIKLATNHHKSQICHTFGQTHTI
jgi:hypothetical protein